MYILDHAVAPWFVEVTGSAEILYFLLPQYLPWQPATPPAGSSTGTSQSQIKKELKKKDLTVESSSSPL